MCYRAFNVQCKCKDVDWGPLEAIVPRDVPDSDLAGYPAKFFAGYRISGFLSRRLIKKLFQE